MMVLEGIDPKVFSQQLADEWSGRIGERLRQIGVPEEELNENVHIIHTFTRIATEVLVKEPRVELAYNKQAFELSSEHVHQIIELFLRGVNQVAKRLRGMGKPWGERKDIIEQVSWKIFNLAKMLVAIQNVPAPVFKNVLKNHEDLKTMMKHSAEELLRRHIAGEPDDPDAFDPTLFQ